MMMTFLNMFDPALLFGMPGMGEWIIIALVVLLLFGARKIPELARGLGRGIREFKDAANEVKREIDTERNDLNRTFED